MIHTTNTGINLRRKIDMHRVTISNKGVDVFQRCVSDEELDIIHDIYIKIGKPYTSMTIDTVEDPILNDYGFKILM
jgi:hypothetical protein